eukprot:TRINITY_DN5157_c0_g2_i1.p1 TRINITY_DN5157_c0_g2~~TRINITY_DN5157_c0_g2_i1.p1  ORF type:complete len:548 (-),score=87.70 TRINITY_DN5157_c0_g2_i1:15-1658(-)
MDPADEAAIRAALAALGEEFDESSGFSVLARTFCPHLEGATLFVPTGISIDAQCSVCGEDEAWICGICGAALCSRYKNKHMAIHAENEHHKIGLSLSDLSVWCFECDSYLDVYAIPAVQPLYAAAHLAKFGHRPQFPSTLSAASAAAASPGTSSGACVGACSSLSSSASCAAAASASSSSSVPVSLALASSSTSPPTASGAAPAVSILGIGTPLIDISSEVDPSLLERYGLELDGTTTAEEQHQALFEEIKSWTTVRYTAGGSGLNTIRFAQWMLQERGATAFMGIVGDDAFAVQLRNACQQDNVQSAFLVDTLARTGCCAVLVCGKTRSLCTRLDGCGSYGRAFLKQWEQWQLFERARIVFIVGYFVARWPETVRLAYTTAARNGALFCLSLGAASVVRNPAWKAALTEAMPYVDVLFCNEAEALAWACAEGWLTNDVAFVGTRLSLIPSSKDSKRTVVITRDRHPVVVAVHGVTTEHPVLEVQDAEIVDTTGAGDAFAGGFLAALTRRCDVAACCKTGAYAASVVLRQVGCTLPAHQPERVEWKS